MSRAVYYKDKAQDLIVQLTAELLRLPTFPDLFFPPHELVRAKAVVDIVSTAT